MRYSIHINAVKCQEWGLNLSQGALFDLLNQASSWAKNIIVEGEVYFWVSRNMVIDEIPLAYTKADTVYRAFKELADKNLIVHIKQGQKDLIRLTEKGKEWNAKNTEINPNNGNKSEFSNKKQEKNSEINPTFHPKLGNKSEKTPKNSDLNPTDKNTIYPITNNQGTSKKTHTPEKPKSENSDLENSSQKKTKKSDLEKMGIKPPVRITNLTDLGVSPQVAYDFLLNKKNHEITHTALVRNQNQAEKAGLTLDKALEFAVNKGWQAFTADYYFNATRSQGQAHANTQPAYQNHATAPAQSSHASYNDNLMAELERELAKQQSQYAPDDRYHGNVYDMETPV